MAKNRASVAGKSRDEAQLRGSIERCHARWHGLFFGVRAVVADRDPTTLRVVEEALIAAGLMHKDDRPFAEFTHGLFEMDPRPDIVQLTQRFLYNPRVPSLRGKTRRAQDPVSVYLDCMTAYFHLKKLPRSDDERRPALKRLAKEILPSLLVVRRCLSPTEIDDLAKSYPAPGELAINLVALARGESPGTIARLKTRGAKHFAPDLRSLWRRTGIERIRVTE